MRWRFYLKRLLARSSSHLFDGGNAYQNHPTDIFSSAGLTPDEVICWDSGINEFERPPCDIYEWIGASMEMASVVGG